MKKVVLCIPTVSRPFGPCLDSIEASIPIMEAADWKVDAVYEVGNAYISGARAMMLRKALDTKPDVIVFIDHDLGWDEGDLLKLIQTEGDVVAGTYRFKDEKIDYMSTLVVDKSGRPIVRSDGCIKADRVPAGFLKLTVQAIDKYMGGYPDLCFGPRFNSSVDLFNHGAHERVWWGEDYAFCRNWTKIDGEIWIVPNLNLTHYLQTPKAVLKDGEAKLIYETNPFPGNFHQYLMTLPGGSNDPNKSKGDSLASSLE